MRASREIAGAGEPARVAGAVEALAVLDGDPGHGRERLGLAQHAVGQIRLQADALPLAGAERSALVQDRVRDPEPPEAVHESGAAQEPHVRLGQPERVRPPAAASSETARAVAQEVGRLQVDEVGDRQERGVEALAGEHDGERRLGVDHGIPHPDGVETREDDVGLGLHEVGQRRVEVPAAPLARELLRGLDSADAVRDLDELGDLRDPGGERDLLALELARPAASVPALVRRADGRRRPRPAGRAARPWFARWPRGGRSCRRPRGARRARTRARAGIGAAAGCPEPRNRIPVAAIRRLLGSWSYLIDFRAMSSPNHLACSWASEWQPTLTSSAV